MPYPPPLLCLLFGPRAVLQQALLLLKKHQSAGLYIAVSTGSLPQRSLQGEHLANCHSSAAKMGILERIKEIEQEMDKTQRNKATEGHLGMLKARLAKLRSELLTPSSGGGGGQVTSPGCRCLLPSAPSSIGAATAAVCAQEDGHNSSNGGPHVNSYGAVAVRRQCSGGTCGTKQAWSPAALQMYMHAYAVHLCPSSGAVRGGHVTDTIQRTQAFTDNCCRSRHYTG